MYGEETERVGDATNRAQLHDSPMLRLLCNFEQDKYRSMKIRFEKSRQEHWKPEHRVSSSAVRHTLQTSVRSL